MIISAAFAAEHAAEHADMPFYMEPEFWVALAFLMVVVLAYKKVSKAITTSLDARSAKIKGSLDEARKLREDAQALLAEYQRKQRDALQEAETIVSHARHEADRLKKDSEVALQAAIERREKQAVERIAQAEAQAMDEVRAMAVDLAVAAATKLIAQKMAPDAQDALIAESIQALPSKLH